MTNTINMVSYARMLSGLDPMLHQPEILVEPQPRANYPLSNIHKIGDDYSRVSCQGAVASRLDGNFFANP
jgi:hypothetical protein